MTTVQLPFFLNSGRGANRSVTGHAFDVGARHSRRVSGAAMNVLLDSAMIKSMNDDEELTLRLAAQVKVNDMIDAEDVACVDSGAALVVVCTVSRHGKACGDVVGATIVGRSVPLNLLLLTYVGCIAHANHPCLLHDPIIVCARLWRFPWWQR